VLAGRNLAKIEPLARELGLQARAFALDDVAEAAKQLQGCTLVMHCAGPFSVTARPMMAACLQAGAHYLDITGEIAVFEMAQTFAQQARQAGVVICPGVGFDVIPTDCVAAKLKQKLPDATHLALGFDTASTLSPGTAKTSVEGLAQTGKVRRDGRIIDVPLAHHVRHIDFGGGRKQAMAIPWGDVSTAFHSTGIPNVEVFIPASTGMVMGARLARHLRPLMANATVQKALQALLARTIKGPDEAKRSGQHTHVWDEARNARGDVVTARVRTANVYSLTVVGAWAVIEHVLQHPPAGGVYTPSRLVGPDLVTRLPGSSAFEFA
jgi:short subunit dehydrogenase-like uncharacterized protein